MSHYMIYICSYPVGARFIFAASQDVYIVAISFFFFRCQTTTCSREWRSTPADHEWSRYSASSQRSAPYLQHEATFRFFLFSSSDSFSAVPFSGQAILAVFGGSRQASAKHESRLGQIWIWNGIFFETPSFGVCSVSVFPFNPFGGRPRAGSFVAQSML